MEKECWMCENFEARPNFKTGTCFAQSEALLTGQGVEATVIVNPNTVCEKCKFFEMTAEASRELESEEWGNVDTTGVVPRGGYQAARQRGVRPGIDFPASM